MTRRFVVLMAVCLALFLSCSSCSAFAANAMAAPDNPELSAANQLYQSGKFAQAAEKYQAILQADPKLVPAQAGLIRSLLRQQKIDESYAAANSALAAQPNSAPLLAAMGEVEFRRAEMQAAEKSYRSALAADPRETQAYLGLAHMYHVYSLYGAAYQQLKLAHQIAPNDPEVQRRWFGQLPRRERIAAIEAYLAGPHPDDPEETQNLQHYLEYLKATVDKPVHACRLTSKVEQTDTKLESLRGDTQRIVGAGLVVKLNDRNNRLILDTGVSGILIGRKAAEKSHLAPISQIQYAGVGDKGMQGGYIALAEHIRVGELEFADCVVRVTDRASITDEDGLIGADVFSSYLIDIDLPAQKLRLSPLPRRPDETAAPTGLNSEGESRSNPDDKAESPGDQGKPTTAAPARPVPKDRYVAPEMANWTQVLRFGHALLIFTRVNDSTPMLFLIDTGSQRNILSTRAGRQASKISSDPNTHVKGLSGQVSNVYRADKATLVFGHFAQKNQDVVTLDLSSLSKHFGTEISGTLGFELLHLLQVKIDYRDGLVDFVYDPNRWPAAK